MVGNVLLYLLFSSFSGTSEASKNSLLITSNTTAGLPQGPKKEPPPPPPPRPKHNHIRSSSLDLNRLGILIIILLLIYIRLGILLIIYFNFCFEMKPWVILLILKI